MKTPNEIDTRLERVLRIDRQVMRGATQVSFRNRETSEYETVYFYTDSEGNPIRDKRNVTDEMREAKADELLKEINTLDNLHRVHAWTRWELVSGGKLHKNTNCGSLDRSKSRMRTARIGKPELSGMSWEEASEATGVSVCTRCCPEAK